MPRTSTIAQAALDNDLPAKPYEIRAAQPLGLLLRVQPSGVRTFYVQLGRGKRLKLGRAGTMTLGQAQAAAKRALLDPAGALEQRDKRKADVTLADYLDHTYTAHATAHLKRGAQSIGRVRTVWAKLLRKQMGEIAASDVETLRTKRLNAGAAPATVNRDVAALSGVLAQWAKTTGQPHPLRGQKALKVADDQTVRYLTSEELSRLRTALATRDAMMVELGRPDAFTAMVALSLNTGLRQGETFALRWQDVDLSQRVLTVVASHAKGNATRHVPLNAEAYQTLKALHTKDARGLVFPSPVSGARLNNVKRSWATVCTAAALPDFRWHDMRHHFASTLVMRGVSLYQVQTLLGHTNPRMTQRYARLAPATLADAVALL